MHFPLYQFDDPLDFSTKWAISMLFLTFAPMLEAASNRLLFAILINAHPLNLVITWASRQGVEEWSSNL